MSKTCDTCRHFVVTGKEDSGLQSGWKYDVGDCSHPAPGIGGARTKRPGIPSWGSCYQHTPKRKSKQAVSD